MQRICVNTLPMNIYGYVPFFINTLDTIASVENTLTSHL